LNQKLINSAFLDSYKQGASPTDLRQSIINTFFPFFENKKFLEDHAWIWLVQDFIEFEQISNNAIAIRILNNSLRIHNSANKVNQAGSLKVAFGWLRKIHKTASVSSSWILDLFNKRFDSDNIDLEKHVYDLFDDLGIIIEGICKPYLYEIYHQLQVEAGKEVTIGQVEEHTLGALVNKLDKIADLLELTRPGRMGIKLNRWRNIGKHYSWEIKEKSIVCAYGLANKKEIILNLNGLQNLISQILANTTSLILAHRIYYVDNISLAAQLKLLPRDVEPNSKGKTFSIKTMLSAMGFEILGLDVKDTSISLVIKNALLISDDERRMELFQAAIMASHVKQNCSVSLDYFDKNGKPNYRVSYDVLAIQKLMKKDYSAISLVDYISSANYQDLKN